jgi:hypothetical protein
MGASVVRLIRERISVDVQTVYREKDELLSLCNKQKEVLKGE